MKGCLLKGLAAGLVLVELDSEEFEQVLARARAELAVAQAQREVLESRINELESRIDYRMALARQQEITASLLPRYGVELIR